MQSDDASYGQEYGQLQTWRCGRREFGYRDADEVEEVAKGMVLVDILMLVGVVEVVEVVVLAEVAWVVLLEVVFPLFGVVELL